MDIVRICLRLAAMVMSEVAVRDVSSSVMTSPSLYSALTTSDVLKQTSSAQQLRLTRNDTPTEASEGQFSHSCYVRCGGLNV